MMKRIQKRKEVIEAKNNLKNAVVMLLSRKRSSFVRSFATPNKPHNTHATIIKSAGIKR